MNDDFNKNGKAFVIFQPSGRRGIVSTGISILEAAQQLGTNIKAVCGGKGLCGKCKVQIGEGFYEKYDISSKVSNAGEWTKEETDIIPISEKAEGYRLACCGRVRGDLLIIVPEEAQSEQQVITKSAKYFSGNLDPTVKKYHVSLEKPSNGNSIADFERLLAELSEKHNINKLEIDLVALRKLTSILRNHDWEVTVSIWNQTEIIDIKDGKDLGSYGVALDIGTTSVAAYLCNLTTGKVISTASCMNPQYKYGEDIMSRISFQMTNENGLEKLHQEIIGAINKLLARVIEKINDEQGVDEKERYPGDSLSVSDIEDLTVVGNTTMHHLLLGLEPTYLGIAPFIPVVQRHIDVKARDIGIQICKGAYVHILPVESAFVGADNVGVLVSEMPQMEKSTQLIIDIGTNGELVLSDGDTIYSTSCATGPALEGAQLKYGMRAAPGAIERFKILESPSEVDYKVVGREAWLSQSDSVKMKVKGICGSGILEIVSELVRCNLINKTGRFNNAVACRRMRKRWENGEVEFVIAWAEETSIGKDVVITQEDIRNIQLAKAALYCGCKLLMKRLGVGQLDCIKIAGAFGVHIDPIVALNIGLLPDSETSKVISIGNAAGDGAIVALLNNSARETADKIATKVINVKLTDDPEFQDEFVKALQFPHMSDSFPRHLMSK